MEGTEQERFTCEEYFAIAKHIKETGEELDTSELTLWEIGFINLMLSSEEMFHFFDVAKGYEIHHLRALLKFFMAVENLQKAEDELREFDT